MGDLPENDFNKAVEIGYYLVGDSAINGPTSIGSSVRTGSLLTLTRRDTMSQLYIRSYAANGMFFRHATDYNTQTGWQWVFYKWCSVNFDEET